MRKFVFALIACVALSGAAAARTVAVPPNDPAIVVTLPSSWKTEKIDYGYSAMSPNNDVFLSVEYAKAANVEGMMKLNDDWMKENSIKPVKPTKEEGTLNGIPVTHFAFDTTDENGPTLVDFFLMEANKHAALITIWGSIAERKTHKTDVDAFISSLKPTH